MSTPERPRPAADLPARLALVLAGEEPAARLREALSRCQLPETARDRLLVQAPSLGERGRRREPRASSCELQLALG
ncbi:MAG TPA: hypothetical protein VGM29_18120, partial [Polyangiaceae bacterium]